MAGILNAGASQCCCGGPYNGYCNCAQEGVKYGIVTYTYFSDDSSAESRTREDQTCCSDKYKFRSYSTQSSFYTATVCVACVTTGPYDNPNLAYTTGQYMTLTGKNPLLGFRWSQDSRGSSSSEFSETSSMTSPSGYQERCCNDQNWPQPCPEDPPDCPLNTMCRGVPDTFQDDAEPSDCCGNCGNGRNDSTSSNSGYTSVVTKEEFEQSGGVVFGSVNLAGSDDGFFRVVSLVAAAPQLTYVRSYNESSNVTTSGCTSTSESTGGQYDLDVTGLQFSQVSSGSELEKIEDCDPEAILAIPDYAFSTGLSDGSETDGPSFGCRVGQCSGVCCDHCTTVTKKSSNYFGLNETAYWNFQYQVGLDEDPGGA